MRLNQAIAALLMSYIGLAASWSQTPNDYHQQVEEVLFSDPVKALELAEKAMNIVPPNSIEKVDALNDLGTAQYYTDEYEKAEKNLKEALELSIAINYPKGEADARFNLGDMYILTGNYGAATEYQSAGLEIYKTLDDNDGISDCLNGIGIIYTEQGDYEKALDYFNQALESGTEITIGDTYTYLAQLFQEMESWKDAEKYALLGLEQGLKNEDGYIISGCDDVLGLVFSKKGETDIALNYLSQSLEMKTELEDIQGLANTLNIMGAIYKDLGQFDLSRETYKKSFDYSFSIGAKDEVRTASVELAKLLATKEQYDSAFFYQNIFIDVNDEIVNENAYKSISEMEKKIEARKKEQEIALLEQEKEYQRFTNKIITYSSIIIVLLLLAGGLIILRRYKEKKRANDALAIKNIQITEQKEIIEEKSKEITDSIHYAQRIQKAILPPDAAIQKKLPGSFVLYKAKDIVAGDFYWMETIDLTSLEEGASRTNQHVTLIAACDCTGHGVPGAMVSVVCNNALNRSVREYGLITPGEILDKTREIVIQEFEKSEEEVKDGMDVALCSLQQSEFGYQLQYAGAHNPLWILRKNADEVEEIKANKQPIGKFDHPVPFTTHSITITPGDTIFIFSDGFADQFGGDRGKKFKTANFKKLLVSIQHETMNRQKELIDKAFENWRGDIEQLDDVCVIGIKIPPLNL